MNTKSYISIRNQTLLFFCEKLIERPRTLHDLSCQFGSKGFTREMRQIAGGSQSGLRKFLSNYPSLFQIQSTTATTPNQAQNNLNNPPLGEETEIVVYKDFDESGEGSKSSFECLAIEYFRSCLMQYGPGCSVPVKSLLGHRSQASSEIRFRTGQHTSEFKDFLKRNPSVFTMSECTEFVRLTQFAHLAESSIPSNLANSEIDSKGKSTGLEPKSREAFSTVKFIYEFIESKGPMLIDQLFNLIINSDENILKTFIRCPNDLATFIRFHSGVFAVNSNVVTFAEAHKVGLEYLKLQFDSSGAPPTAPKPLPVLYWPPPDEDSSDLTSLSSSTTTDDADSSNSSLNQSSPKNPLTSPSSQAQPQPLMSLVVPPPTAKNTPKGPNKLAKSASVDSRGTSFKERMNRAILSNISPLPITQGFKNLNEHVITNLNSARTIINDFLKTVESGETPGIISLDSEGVNLGQGNLTLCQMGLPNGTVYVFDILMTPDIMGELSRILVNLEIIKVMHDCRNDSANLYNQFGIKLANVFDTQVGQFILSDGKNYNLNKLCELHGLKGNEFKDKIKNLYRSDNRFWMRRPLTPQMLNYAIGDVGPLITLHYKIRGELEASGNWDYFVECCNDQILALIEPEQVKSKKRLVKNEADLKELKNKLEAFELTMNNNLQSYNYTYQNIVLSNREIRLLKHLPLTEGQIEILKRSNLKIARKLNSFQERASIIPSNTEDLSAFDSDNYSLSGLGPVPSFNSLENNNNVQSASISNTESLPLNSNNQRPTAAFNDMNRFNSSQTLNSNYIDNGTQTLSTGDVVILHLFK